MVYFRKITSYHLVKTYGVVSSDTELFLVMELMHHGSLKKYLTEKRKSDNIFDLFTIQVSQITEIVLENCGQCGRQNI